MTVQYSVAVRNAQLDAFESTTGATAVLKIFTGAQPADCATADSGTLLAEMTLPADWMSAAAAGVKELLGTWQDASANAGGVAAHYRIYESTGTTCHSQGSVGQGSGDLSLDNTTIAITQQVDINTFVITAGNA